MIRLLAALLVALAVVSSGAGQEKVGPAQSKPQIGEEWFVSDKFSPRGSFGYGVVIANTEREANRFINLLIAKDFEGYRGDASYLTGLLVRHTFKVKIISDPIASSKHKGLDYVEVRIIEGRWKGESGFVPVDFISKKIAFDAEKIKDISEADRQATFKAHCESWNAAVAHADKVLGVTGENDKVTLLSKRGKYEEVLAAEFDRLLLKNGPNVKVREQWEAVKYGRAQGWECELADR